MWHLHKTLAPFSGALHAFDYVGACAERQHSKKAKKWADENLVALTGIPTDACNTPWGDHLISLAVQNKQVSCLSLQDTNQKIARCHLLLPMWSAFAQ